MPIPTEPRLTSPRATPKTVRGLRSPLLVWSLMGLAGCGGEPSESEIRNARAFEALLTAVSLRNKTEMEKDAELIEARHASGELSDARNRELQEIIGKARAGDWGGAQGRAYEFRAQFGDQGAYFK